LIGFMAGVLIASVLGAATITAAVVIFGIEVLLNAILFVIMAAVYGKRNAGDFIDDGAV